jgi:hypothetical protein
MRDTQPKIGSWKDMSLLTEMEMKPKKEGDEMKPTGKRWGREHISRCAIRGKNRETDILPLSPLSLADQLDRMKIDSQASVC